MKPNFRKLSALILTLTLFVFLFGPVSSANATNPSNISDTMTRQKTSTASSHTVVFTMSGSVTFDASDTITYDYGTAGFTLAAATTSDVSFNDGTARTVVAAGTSPACSAGANNVTVTTNTGTGLITVTACSGFTSSAGGATVTFKIGTAVGGGTDRLTNPGSNGSKTLTLAGSYGDASTNFAVPILTDDQVVVSATVDPTITSTLSANTCSLGTLSSGAVNFCSYTNTVTTNAGGGYASTIIDLSGTSAGKLCSPSVGTCTNDIGVAAGDNDVDQGSEEYGVGTSKASQTITQYSTCANNNPQPAKAISTSAQQYANAAGPVSSDVTTLCHAASITGTTPSGNYTATVTHITTGTF